MSYYHEPGSRVLGSLFLLLFINLSALVLFITITSGLNNFLQIPRRGWMTAFWAGLYILSFFIVLNMAIISPLQLFFNRHIAEYDEFVRNQCRADLCRLPSLYEDNLGINVTYDEYFVFDKKDTFDKCHEKQLDEASCSYTKQLAIDNTCYVSVRRMAERYFFVFDSFVPLKGKCGS
jgi:hypothetical protein